ncbi:MAG: response regulator transcription factor [Balneolales bacterium]
MKKIRLLIIEDNRLLREGITAVLKDQPDLEIIAALENSENLLSKIRTSDLDIVLLDLGLRSHNSLEVVKLFATNGKAVKVIVMGLFPTQSEILDFIQAGVNGFILKDATVEDFLATIRLVNQGEKILPPFLIGSLFSQIIDEAVSNPASERKLISSITMTSREKQVIGLISEGLTNKEIAQKLHISNFTVKSHVHNILEKLALHSRLQIAKYAHDMQVVNTAAEFATLTGK